MSLVGMTGALTSPSPENWKVMKSTAGAVAVIGAARDVVGRGRGQHLELGRVFSSQVGKSNGLSWTSNPASSSRLETYSTDFS